MAYTRKIGISNLLVNKDNPRFEPQTSQREAINRLLEGNMIDKMLHLAEDIAKKGLNPMERLLVQPSGDDKTFIVLEGNRRISSIKLLKRPELADDENVRRRFERLHKLYADSIQTDIDCCVIEEDDDANYWIGLKHGDEQNGVGVVRWTATQKQRFDEQQGKKKTLARQVLTLLENSSTIENELKKSFESVAITSLERLLSDANVREVLGLKLDKGFLYAEYQEEETVRILSAFIKRQLAKDFNVNKIRNVKDRKAFIDTTDSNDLPRKEKKAKEPWAIVTNDEENKTATPDVVKTKAKKPAKSKKQQTVEQWYESILALDEERRVTGIVDETCKKQIIATQEFVNDNKGEVSCLKIHSLLQKLMPRSFHELINGIKPDQEPNTLIQVFGGNNQLLPNARSGEQHITKGNDK